MSFLNTNVSLENHISNSFFINSNKNSFSLCCEEEDIEIINQDSETYNSDDTVNEIYSNITENSSILLALNAMECIIQDEYDININSDTNKEEYDNTINKDNKNKNDPSYAAAMENDKTKEDKFVEFLNYIKVVFEKIHSTSILLFKKLYTFSSVDMKNITIWYNENGNKHKNQIINSDSIAMNFKLPKISFDLFIKNINKDKSDIFNSMNSILKKIYFMMNSEIKDGDFVNFQTQIDDLKNKTKLFSVKEFSDTLYKDSKITTISSKQFFEKFNFTNLNSTSQFNDLMRDCESITRLSNEAINYIKKIINSNIKKEYKGKIRKSLLSFTSSFNSFIAGYVWLTSQYIHYNKSGLRFSQKVIKNLPKE